jgi:hypothetical protein
MVLFSNALYCLLYRADIELFVFSPILLPSSNVEGIVKQHQGGQRGYVVIEERGRQTIQYQSYTGGNRRHSQTASGGQRGYVVIGERGRQTIQYQPYTGGNKGQCESASLSITSYIGLILNC